MPVVVIFALIAVVPSLSTVRFTSGVTVPIIPPRVVVPVPLTVKSNAPLTAARVMVVPVKVVLAVSVVASPRVIVPAAIVPPPRVSVPVSVTKLDSGAVPPTAPPSVVRPVVVIVNVLLLIETSALTVFAKVMAALALLVKVVLAANLTGPL